MMLSASLRSVKTLAAIGLLFLLAAIPLSQLGVFRTQVGDMGDVGIMPPEMQCWRCDGASGTCLQDGTLVMDGAACPNGEFNDAAACSATCDMIMPPPEVMCWRCDGASGTCLEDGVVPEGTPCPGGGFSDASSCSATCQMVMPVCGDGKWDEATEACDGGDRCEPDCTCRYGMEPNGFGGCKCTLWEGNGGTCCEDMDANGNGVIDDPDEARIKKGPGGSCDGFYCIWCEGDKGKTCNLGVAPSCADCSDPNTDSDPDNDDPDWEPDDACVCTNTNSADCSAYECSQPYTGDCNRECDDPFSTDCYVRRDGNRVVRGTYTAKLYCDYGFDNEDAYCSALGGGSGGLGGAGGTLGGIGGSPGGGAGGAAGAGGESGGGGSSTGSSDTGTSLGSSGGSSANNSSTLSTGSKSSTLSGGGSSISTLSKPSSSSANSLSNGSNSSQGSTGSSGNSSSTNSVSSSSASSLSFSSASSQSSLSFSVSFSSLSLSSALSQSSLVNSFSSNNSNSSGLSFSFPSNSSASSGRSTSSVSSTVSHNSSTSSIVSNGSSLSTVVSGGSSSSSSIVIATAFCGDGIVQTALGEDCDLGASNGAPGSASGCSCDPNLPTCVAAVSGLSWKGCRWPRCGDGIVNNEILYQGKIVNFDLISEQCDDGNSQSGDGCNALCQVEKSSASSTSFVSFASQSSGDSSTFSVTLSYGSSQGPDDDDGDGDGFRSSSSRRLVAAAGICGDGNLNAGEECDDSNRRDNDGCNAECLLEIGICGDGIVQSLLGEQCESSTHDKSLPFTCVRCRYLSTSCGDGTLDAGEECDNGSQNSTSPDASCRPDCSLARCGDAVLDSVEDCDDGNRVSGDGCDRYCQLETSTTGTTQVAADQNTPTDIAFNQQQVQSQNWQYGIPFPYQSTTQGMPYQLPLAQLQPLIQGQAPIGDTGPAAVAVIGAGAAAGFSWMRRKK